MKISKFSEGVLPVVAAACAGSVVVNDYYVDLAAGDLVGGTIVDLGPLPAYHTVVDAVLIPDDLDTNGSPAIVLDVGLMSGTVGDDDNTRTCGAELFSSANGAQTGTPARMSAKSGFLIKPVGYDRSIGVKVATGAATAAAGRVRVRVAMTAADQTRQF